MTRGVTNGNRTHHLTVAQRVDLTSVARNTGADQGVGREGHGLHLAVRADVEGVSPAAKAFDVSSVTDYTATVLLLASCETLTVCHQRWM